MPVPNQKHNTGRKRGKPRTDKSKDCKSVMESHAGPQPGGKKSSRPAGTPVVIKGGRKTRQEVV